MNNPLNTWFMAIRPKTLTAAVAPVLIGTAMAFGDGIHHFPTAALCLFVALTIQIGTNLANDYFDFKNGADTEERIGPQRVTQSGLISPNIVMAGFIISFLLAALGSYFLVMRGGKVLGIIAALSILSGIFYTAGPKPLGYIGLGDLFVLIFFGPVAVGGTYFVQSNEINYAVILAGFIPGLISVGILTVNNLRDRESDQKSGKYTLAVRFGKSFAQYEYVIAVITACLLPVLIFYLIDDHKPIILCSFLSLLFVKIFHTLFTKSDGPSLNGALAGTGMLLLVFSIAFSVAWIL